MVMKSILTSARYPYIPLTVEINKRSETIEALLDTGLTAISSSQKGF
jgi:hypothetical protein